MVRLAGRRGRGAVRPAAAPRRRPARRPRRVGVRRRRVGSIAATRSPERRRRPRSPTRSAASSTRFAALLGRDPTHLDSHQHVHRREPVRSVLLELGCRAGRPAPARRARSATAATSTDRPTRATRSRTRCDPSGSRHCSGHSRTERRSSAATPATPPISLPPTRASASGAADSVRPAAPFGARRGRRSSSSPSRSCGR